MMIRELFCKLKYKRKAEVSPETIEAVNSYIEKHLAEEASAVMESKEAPEDVLFSSYEEAAEESGAEYYEDKDELFTGELFLPEKAPEDMEYRAPKSMSAPRMYESPSPDLRKIHGRKAESSGYGGMQVNLHDISDYISGIEMTFQQTLLRLIDRKGWKDPQVYRKANLDRKLFSKIRSNKDYKPSKNTALSLAIALELSLEETSDLLQRAGLALSPSNIADLIVKYCIINRIYDIYEVNSLLYAYDQQILGS